MLKHVRWVRNKLAHDSGAYQISEENDIAFVQDFYERIFYGSDPLTQLRKTKQTGWNGSQQYQQQKPYSQPSYYSRSQEKPNKKRLGASFAIISIGLLVVVALIIVLISIFLR